MINQEEIIQLTDHISDSLLVYANREHLDVPTLINGILSVYFNLMIYNCPQEAWHENLEACVDELRRNLILATLANSN